jgi:hypothetical protein
MKPMITVIIALVMIGFGKKDTIGAINHLQSTGACVRQAVGTSSADQMFTNAMKCR